MGTLEDTREVLLARIATLKQEEQRRLVNIAQRMEVGASLESLATRC